MNETDIVPPQDSAEITPISETFHNENPLAQIAHRIVESEAEIENTPEVVKDRISKILDAQARYEKHLHLGAGSGSVGENVGGIQVYDGGNPAEWKLAKEAEMERNSLFAQGDINATAIGLLENDALDVAITQVLHLGTENFDNTTVDQVGDALAQKCAAGNKFYYYSLPRYLQAFPHMNKDGVLTNVLLDDKMLYLILENLSYFPDFDVNNTEYQNTRLLGYPGDGGRHIGKRVLDEFLSFRSRMGRENTDDFLTRLNSDNFLDVAKELIRRSKSDQSLNETMQSTVIRHKEKLSQAAKSELLELAKHQQTVLKEKQAVQAQEAIDRHKAEQTSAADRAYVSYRMGQRKDR